MSSFHRQTPAQIAELLDRVCEAAYPATLAELSALMASLGLRESERETTFVQYASDRLSRPGAVAYLREAAPQVEELKLYVSDFADESDQAQLDEMEDALADTKAALKKRLGKPQPEYPRGKSKADVYGEEHRYTYHRLPNGLDILVPRGVDPTQPVKNSKAPRWVLPQGHVLTLQVLKSGFLLRLQPSVPARYEDGLAVMWDGSDTAPDGALAGAASPSPVQTELLEALSAAPWPANREQLQDLLRRMEFEFQMDLFNRESWSKDVLRDENDFVGTLHNMVIRTYPETGRLELSTNVVLDEVLAKKRKGPPFKGMEQAFDQALAHAKTVLGEPTHQSATQELGTSEARSALRLAQWRRDPVTVSLVLKHDGPDFAMGIDWVIEPDVSAAIATP